MEQLESNDWLSTKMAKHFGLCLLCPNLRGHLNSSVLQSVPYNPSKAKPWVHKLHSKFLAIDSLLPSNGYLQEVDNSTCYDWYNPYDLELIEFEYFVNYIQN